MAEGDEFIGVDAAEPVKTITVTEQELVIVEARRDELLAKKAEEDAVRVTASEPLRQAAIELHRELCPSTHAAPVTCSWYERVASDADLADKADWTEAQHRRWLATASISATAFTAAGWKVEEPA